MMKKIIFPMNILVNLIIILNKEKAPSIGKMEKNTLENGKMVKWLARDACMLLILLIILLLKMAWQRKINNEFKKIYRV